MEVFVIINSAELGITPYIVYLLKIKPYFSRIDSSLCENQCKGSWNNSLAPEMSFLTPENREFAKFYHSIPDSRICS